MTNPDPGPTAADAYEQAATEPGPAGMAGDTRDQWCCPACGEPAVQSPPTAWTDAWGPPASWSHLDGEPLCPVIGPDGYEPAPPVPRDSIHDAYQDQDAPRERTDADLPGDFPGDGAQGFDLGLLEAITGRDGFAMFDPSVPGGVRELSPEERGRLDVAATRPAAAPAAASPPAASVPVEGGYGARTDDRQAHHPATGSGLRARTAVEDARFDAGLERYHARLAHDPDPVLDAEIARLDALEGLRPLPNGYDAIDARDEHGDLPESWYAAQDPSDDPTSKERGGPDWWAEQRVLDDHHRDHDTLWLTDSPRDTRRLQQRIDDIRVRLAARDTTTDPATRQDVSDEQRREQLRRWHHDDTGAIEETGSEADTDPGAGWSR